MVKNPFKFRTLGYEDHGYYPFVLRIEETYFVEGGKRQDKYSTIRYVVHNKETGMDDDFVGTKNKEKALWKLKSKWEEWSTGSRRVSNPKGKRRVGYEVPEAIKLHDWEARGFVYLEDYDEIRDVFAREVVRLVKYPSKDEIAHELSNVYGIDIIGSDLVLAEQAGDFDITYNVYGTDYYFRIVKL